MKKTIATCSLALAAIFSLQAFAEQYEFRLNADGVVLEKPVDLTGESCRDSELLATKAASFQGRNP